MDVTGTLEAALARMDADIAAKRGIVVERLSALEAAQADLADMELKRVGAEALITYLDLDSTSHAAPARPAGASGGFSPSTLVRTLVEKSGRSKFTNEDVNQLAEAAGYHMTRTQVSNALTYLSRPSVNYVQKTGGRGNWELVQSPAKADGPAEAGPSDEASPPLAPEVMAG
jgi:hypothetical protein